MYETDMENLLQEVLEFEDEEIGVESQVKRVSTFESVGLLTNNHGIVVRMKDGSEFQITIVKSR